MPRRSYDSIGGDVRDAVLDATDGSNGLRVSGDRHEADLDPEWQGDDYDYAAEGDPHPLHDRNHRTYTLPEEQATNAIGKD